LDEIELLKEMKDFLLGFLDRMANHPEKDEPFEKILRETITIFDNLTLANRQDIEDFGKLKGLVENVIVDRLEMGVYLRVIKRKMKDCEEHIESLSVQRDFYVDKEYILGDMLEWRIQTENKIWMLGKALLDEYEPKPRPNTH
jgi:hypothetical protein